MQMKNF